MRQERWFELRTGTPADAGMHCLIWLNDFKSPGNGRERRDVAAELATAVLGRFPTPDELRPICIEAVAEFTGFDYHLIFLKGSVVGLKPPRWNRPQLTRNERRVPDAGCRVTRHQCHKPNNSPLCVFS